MNSLLNNNLGIKFAISLLSLIILVSLFLLSRDFLYAGTNVSGILSEDTSWDVGSSPYTVTGHVKVASGATLTIDEGVTVKFDSGKVLEVEGTLVARGTSGNGITFTSSAASPAAGDWGYIEFKDSSTDASFDGNGDYQSGSILEYVTVQYGGSTDEAQILVDTASPFINNSTIEYSDQRGIRIYVGASIVVGSDGKIKITNSTISNNKLSGIVCHISYQNECYIHNNNIHSNASTSGDAIQIGGFGSLTISNNNIYENEGYSLSLDNKDDSLISNNTMTENQGGIYAVSSQFAAVRPLININGNTISHNGKRSSSPKNAIGGITLLQFTNAELVSITNNIIHNNYAGGTGGGAEIDIDNMDSFIFQGNTVTNNTSANRAGGAYIDVVASDTGESSSISNNTFAFNSGLNFGALYLKLDKGGSNNTHTFSNNTIAYNTTTNGPSSLDVGANIAIVFDSSNGEFKQNNIIGNTGKIAVRGDDSKVPSLENNWWNTTSTVEIAALIHDWNDDASLGILDYTPFLTAPSTSTPPIPPQNVAAQTGLTSIQLTWDANPESDITGYKVYYDTDQAGYPYANPVDAGDVTTHTLSGLNTGTTYYLAVAAYDSDSNESWVSTNTTLNTLGPTPTPVPAQTATPTPTPVPTPTPTPVSATPSPTPTPTPSVVVSAPGTGIPAVIILGLFMLFALIIRYGWNRKTSP